MSRRLFLPLLLLLALNRAPGSDSITAPAGGASGTVSQPHVTAELIPENSSIQAGQPFDVAVHLHMDAGWHTYWRNPGDAGLATTIAWTLPPGFSAGPIRWPTPELHNMGPLVTYGYAGDVYLLTTITPPPPTANIDLHFPVKAKVSWLVCQEACIPGHADLEITLDSNPFTLRLPVDNHALFDQARARLPVMNTRWNERAAYGATSFELQLTELIPPKAPNPGHLRFFPGTANVLSTLPADQGAPVALPDGAGQSLTIALQQNGDKPATLNGVVVSDQPLIGDAKAVEIADFPVGNQPLTTASSTAADRPLLVLVLGAAFIGGLILNLMPCVLPVLSLKVFSLVKHAGGDSRGAWKQGLAFSAGVVVSFWLLAGLLILLRHLGEGIGWGFQMQSPGFVLALIFLFFAIALNLFGLFELGTSLVGLDAEASSRLHGLPSSFANGALATLAATPCTAPFMGSSLGYAAQQSPFVAMLVFTFLALGMAAPYLLLTCFPAALRFVPKPGPWMETFRQLMGFLLLATVVFLVYVFGALTSSDQLPSLLGALLAVAVGLWIYGRYANASRRARLISRILTFILLLFAIWWAVPLARMEPGMAEAVSANSEWKPWSPDAISTALTQNRPVFVDFTAAWCLSCKVNERVVLESSAVKSAFAGKNILLLRGDWTRTDPAITQVLRQYNRDGVPLYLLYSPKAKDSPQVLPEVLTQGMVLDAINKL